MIYVKYNSGGGIEACSDSPHEGFVLEDFNIVYVNGVIYKADAVPSPTLEDQLTAIEAKYAQKQAELDKALVAALRMDGAQEAAARTAIKQKSLKLIQDQNDEIDALVAQQNGG